MLTERKQIIITGPCAAESEAQIISCAENLKERNLGIMRMCWWKPRTQPGFEGVGDLAAPWAAQVTKMGIIMGTEVLIPEHVTEVIKGIDKNGGDSSQILLWIGSRNQNHLTQREIAARTVAEAHNNVKLLIKNQPWSDEKHWLGIIDHVVSGGMDPSRIILCHRGFAPNGGANSNNFRNPPDFDMAMRVKEKTNLPMILDPSHIGGEVESVFKVVEMAAGYNFDGLMVEAHPSPENAKTDRKQQLSFQELDLLLTLRDETWGNLNRLRKRIDTLDKELISILSLRMDAVGAVGKHKSRRKIEPLDNTRWQEVLRTRAKWAQENNLPLALVEDILKIIHHHALLIEKAEQ